MYALHNELEVISKYKFPLSLKYPTNQKLDKVYSDYNENTENE